MKPTSPKNGDMPSSAAKAQEAPQPTLMLSELRPGTIYRDALSGLLVLVEDRTDQGPDPDDPRRMVRTTSLVGRFWNPIYGAHQVMELRNNQLMKAAI